MEEEKQQEAEKESVVTSPSDSKYLFHAHFISKRTHRKYLNVMVLNHQILNVLLKIKTNRLQPEVCWQQSLGIQYCNAEGKPILLGRLPCDFLRLDDEGAFGKNVIISINFYDSIKMEFLISLKDTTVTLPVWAPCCKVPSLSKH